MKRPQVQWLTNKKTDLTLFASLIGFNLLFLTLLSDFMDRSPIFYDMSLYVVLFSYPHLLSTYIRVYGTPTFNERRALKFAPLLIFGLVSAMYVFDKYLLLLLFGLSTFHHHIMQQVGLLKLSHRAGPDEPAGLSAILLPTSIGAYLLSHPNKYQPPGGGNFSWLYMPASWQSFCVAAVALALLLSVIFEWRLYQRTRVVLAGKYLQYIVSFVTWFLIPALTDNWAYVYLAGGIAHGWYYIGLCHHYVSDRDTPGRVTAFTGGKLLQYAVSLGLAGLLLALFVQGAWTMGVPGAMRFVSIVAITLTLSHYWFDAHIWRRPKVRALVHARRRVTEAVAHKVCA